MPIRVTVALFSILREGRFQESQVLLPEGADVGSLLERLGIGPLEVGVVVVNGKDETLSRTLQAGDRVSLIPPLGGG